MKVKIAWLVVPLSPFLLALWARVYWFVLGHEWVPSPDTDTVFFFLGILFGLIVIFVADLCDVDLGEFYIGKGKD